MTAFALDPRLLSACHPLGELEHCHLLLMDNAALPWFILVPETGATELCDLDPDTHSHLFSAAAAVGRFVRSEFTVDKLNVATLGNLVPQMHLHVIGRRRDDYCWPGGPWGVDHSAPYDAAALTQMRALVDARLEVR